MWWNWYGFKPQMLNRRTEPFSFLFRDGKNNFEKIKNMITKDDLKKAFEQGERYDYRVTKAQCFNRWYNQNYLDSEKCKICKHSDQKHYKNCLNCIEHLNFTK